MGKQNPNTGQNPDSQKNPSAGAMSGNTGSSDFHI